MDKSQQERFESLSIALAISMVMVLNNREAAAALAEKPGFELEAKGALVSVAHHQEAADAMVVTLRELLRGGARAAGI